MQGTDRTAVAKGLRTELSTLLGQGIERGGDRLPFATDLDVTVHQDRRNTRVAADPPGTITQRVFRSIGGKRHPVRGVAGQYALVDGERPRVVIRRALPLGSRDHGAVRRLGLVRATHQRKRGCGCRQNHTNPHGQH